MTEQEWNTLFGEAAVLTLTDEERRYFALNPLDPTWHTMRFDSKIDESVTRTTLFFEGDIIVKTITETVGRCLGNIHSLNYSESDTRVPTENRELILPLTARGKPKKLSPSALENINPFGCTFTLEIADRNTTKILLNNFRAARNFPVGEEKRIAAIRNEADFHAFTRDYMESCGTDYFPKLEAFRTAERKTVRYKVGDIFRMSYDRTHYCYGIIIGEVRRYTQMPELPKLHNLRRQMTVPLLLRAWELVTERDDMTADELAAYPLGRTWLCSDDDILRGNHPIVGHRALREDDLEFPLLCVKCLLSNPNIPIREQESFGKMFGTVLSPVYDLYIEWGFAQTMIPRDKISDRLRELMNAYPGSGIGVQLGIVPRFLVPEDKLACHHFYRNNLHEPHNAEIRRELFRNLNLPEDCDLDTFARAFGGLTGAEILEKIAPPQKTAQPRSKT